MFVFSRFYSLCCIAAGIVLIAGQAYAQSNDEAPSSEQASKYAGMERIEIAGSGVVLTRPGTNIFNYDKVRILDVDLSYAEGIPYLSDKTEAKLKQTLAKSKAKWFKKNGVEVIDSSDSCTADYKIRFTDIKYDQSKLRNSEKYSHRVFGSALLSVEWLEPETHKLMFVWIVRVPLATQQKDRGNFDRKASRAIARRINKTIDEGEIDVRLSFGNQIQKYKEEAAPPEGCKGLLASSRL